MPIHTTYSSARANLSKLMDRVAEDRDIVYIARRNKADVAMVSAEELAGLFETAHLLRSPGNAMRLLQALIRAQSRQGESGTIEELRREAGLGDEA